MACVIAAPRLGGAVRADVTLTYCTVLGSFAAKYSSSKPDR